MTSQSQSGVSTPAKIRFSSKSAFAKELKLHVDEYFQSQKIARDGGRVLLQKGSILVLTLIIAWSTLMFASPGMVIGVICAVNVDINRQGGLATDFTCERAIDVELRHDAVP